MCVMAPEVLSAATMRAMRFFTGGLLLVGWRRRCLAVLFFID